MIEKAKEILKSFINVDNENDCFPINPLEEKTRDEIKFVLKTIVKLEKELKQTKHNFKNSQTHSKNCYKKLKEKFVKLQYDYNDLQKDYELLDNDYDLLFDKFLKSEKENQELKKYKEILQEFGLDPERPKIREVLICGLMFKEYREAIKILKENFPIKFLGYNKYGAKPYEIMFNGRIMGFDKEKYETLKEVFENVEN